MHSLQSDGAVWPAGPVRQELPDAVSSAVAVTADVDSPHWLILTSAEVVQLPMSHPKAARSVAPTVTLQAEPLVQPHTAAQLQGEGDSACAVNDFGHVWGSFCNPMLSRISTGGTLTPIACTGWLQNHSGPGGPS